MKKLIFIMLAFTLASCVSFDSDFEVGTPPEVVLQRAQEAFDYGAYDDALAIYQVAIERFGDDPQYRVKILYDIGFTTYKLGDKAGALEVFENLMKVYDEEGQRSELPQWPRILAGRVSENIKALETDQEVED